MSLNLTSPLPQSMGPLQTELGSTSSTLLLTQDSAIIENSRPSPTLSSSTSSSGSTVSTTTTQPRIDLSLTQSVQDTTPNTPLLVGDQVEFILKVTNTAIAGLPATAATGVMVKNLLPTGFSFVGATGNGSYSAQTGLWDIGRVAVGNNNSRTLTIRATVLGTGNDVAAYTNIAEVIVANLVDIDSTPNNNVSTEDDWTRVVAAPIKLNVTKEFTEGNVIPAQFNRFAALPDGTVSFEIDVTNNGFTPVSNVVVYDDLTQFLPVGLKVLSVNPGDGQTLDTDNNAQTIEVKFHQIGVGQTKTITVNAKVSAEVNGVNYITPIQLAGVLGAVNPLTNSVDTQLPEYQNVPFDGTFWLSTNFTKNVNDPVINFGFLNIINTAEVIAINGASLIPGTIQSNQARLDVATYKLTGTLNDANGVAQPFTVLSVDPLNGKQISFSLNADWELFGDDGFAWNHSTFLPVGDSGSSKFALIWNKPTDDPNFANNLATWTSFSSSNDVTHQQMLVNFLVNQFVKRGAANGALLQQGTFDLTNQTQSRSQSLTIEASQVTPALVNTITIVVTNNRVSIGNQSFANLQSALNSLSFSVPTGVIISVQGTGTVTARVQTITGIYDFAKNWGIREVNIAPTVTTAIFASGNGKAAYDFSLVRIVKAANTVVQLTGNNAPDTIVGSSRSETLIGGNGPDFLDGRGGNDTYMGGNGPDTFVLRRNGLVLVKDFKSQHDKFGLTRGITFAQLVFTTSPQVSGATRIWVRNPNGTLTALADVLDTAPHTFNPSQFVTV
ncbi:MAG: hypothetical protein NW220_00270 [Leptolyngbyaceae cyanobacterium bins.349]|nr:hypothetical protein [Leptolyngbyaceae cyanobacterium bins.349]